MEDRNQKWIQTVTAGVMLGIMIACVFLFLLKVTGYALHGIQGICLIVLVACLPWCMTVLPESRVFINAAMWISVLCCSLICLIYVFYVTGSTGHGMQMGLLQTVLVNNGVMLVSTGVRTWVTRNRK
ncbi:MAG: hypothetical protein ACI32N_07750 [Bulleidia sp.]